MARQGQGVLDNAHQEPGHLHLPQLLPQLGRYADLLGEAVEQHLRHLPVGDHQGLAAVLAAVENGDLAGCAQVCTTTAKESAVPCSLLLNTCENGPLKTCVVYPHQGLGCCLCRKACLSAWCIVVFSFVSSHTFCGASMNQELVFCAQRWPPFPFPSTVALASVLAQKRTHVDLSHSMSYIFCVINRVHNLFSSSEGL